MVFNIPYTDVCAARRFRLSDRRAQLQHGAHQMLWYRSVQPWWVLGLSVMRVCACSSLSWKFDYTFYTYIMCVWWHRIVHIRWYVYGYMFMQSWWQRSYKCCSVRSKSRVFRKMTKCVHILPFRPNKIILANAKEVLDFNIITLVWYVKKKRCCCQILKQGFAFNIIIYYIYIEWINH